MWWNDNLKITIICHQVLYSGVSGGNKRRSTCTQTSTGETWWDKPMSFIFSVSCQPFWFYKALILIVISWMVPWMTFLALMSLFQVWFDPGIGYVLPGEVIEFHKQAGVKFLSLYHHPPYHHPNEPFPLQVAWAFPVYSEWTQSCWTTATLHSQEFLQICWNLKSSADPSIALWQSPLA